MLREFYTPKEQFHPTELSVENLKVETFERKAVPVYGDLATTIAAKLNDMFKKDWESEKTEDKIETLGRDMGDQTTDFNYKLGRNDVVTGIADTPPTLQDATISVEHVNNMGIGMYNIMEEVAGIVKGINNAVIWSINYRHLFPEQVDLIRDVIVKGNKHVILILLVPNDVGLDEVQMNVPSLYELMASTNFLTVFLTYKVERPIKN